MPPSGNDTPPAPKPVLAEVKYSLPEMLAEIRLERITGSFAMEKLDQQDITKLFKAKPSRRAKSKK